MLSIIEQIILIVIEDLKKFSLFTMLSWRVVILLSVLFTLGSVNPGKNAAEDGKYLMPETQLNSVHSYSKTKNKV